LQLPARTLSTIKLRSSSAMAPMMTTTAVTAGVAGSSPVAPPYLPVGVA
jgi:hypothetical protein